MGRLTHEIVENAIAGNRAALEAVWVEHRGWIAAVAVARAPRDADIEDIMQDIALNMIRSIHTVQEPAAIAGWLREIARNTSVSAGRKTSLRKAALARHALHLTTTSEDTSERQPDDLAALRDLVSALPESYREPLLLFTVRGMSHKQIAQLMSLTPTAVETRIRRARRLMRERAESDSENEKAIAT